MHDKLVTFKCFQFCEKLKYFASLNSDILYINKQLFQNITYEPLKKSNINMSAYHRLYTVTSIQRISS